MNCKWCIKEFCTSKECPYCADFCPVGEFQYVCRYYCNDNWRSDPITNKQKALIENMNEFCTERFDLSIPRTKAEARDYISRNIKQFKLFTLSNWALTNGYF